MQTEEGPPESCLDEDKYQRSSQKVQDLPDGYLWIRIVPDWWTITSRSGNGLRSRVGKVIGVSSELHNSKGLADSELLALP